MKRFILIIFALTLATGSFAQGHHNHKMPNMDEMVSNLSPTQKRQLEKIHDDLKTNEEVIKKKLKAVREEIHNLMDQYGDNTPKMNKLLEQESALQLKLNKLQYQAKVQCDKVISKEQYSEFRQKLKANLKDRKERKQAEHCDSECPFKDTKKAKPEMKKR